ncbi:hypothetical protein FHE72_23570 (plasmid) [Rossellomorea vietnamensis]|uniref:Uncharacterized protein n=1 Tax=Rossellomorea vietnamensis TaxID=218284 RepID=A0A6I6UWW3_9BACI|nr:hypothetical protein [Rossellomorea vietnamensis]QHE63973.1 hypothetical protein FHE72_23570 [Rossellomorea vietnamensis]
MNKEEAVVITLNNLREDLLELIQEAILNKLRVAMGVFEEVVEIQKEIDYRLSSRKGWFDSNQILVNQVIMNKPVRIVARSCC